MYVCDIYSWCFCHSYVIQGDDIIASININKRVALLYSVNNVSGDSIQTQQDARASSSQNRFSSLGMISDK